MLEVMYNWVQREREMTFDDEEMAWEEVASSINWLTARIARSWKRLQARLPTKEVFVPTNLLLLEDAILNETYSSCPRVGGIGACGRGM